MNIKLLSALILLLVSLFSMTQAKASLIVGETYLDSDGTEWEYIGFFDLVEGADSVNDNPTPYNGLEAAAFLFNEDISDLATAAFESFFDISSIVAGDTVVNHLAWYDAYDDAISIMDEDVNADFGGDGEYSQLGDVSAWVDDRGIAGFYSTYVFKTVEVSAPSALFVFGLGLFGVMFRRATN